MKIAIMQPYFFPYLGYFGLIKHTDQFILLDTVQYIRHGWIDRNRILKPDTGWQYIKVPIAKHSRDTIIKDIRIKNDQDWQSRILGQLQHYKKKAPFYDQVIGLVEKIVYKGNHSIVQLNQISLSGICSYLGINAEIQVFSDMNLTIKNPKAPDEWALNICKALPKVNDYWNPSGGMDFFDKKKYHNNSIGLKFIKANLCTYDQKRNVFEKGLSIIDVLMFNDPTFVNAMLDDFVLIS